MPGPGEHRGSQLELEMVHAAGRPGSDEEDHADAPLSKKARGNTPNNKKKPRTYISRLVVTFQECLNQLGAKDVTDAKLESMSVIIHECMSSGSRNYHSVQHVFDISKNITDPIGIIAALFHDCIYYNVDGGLSPLQMEMLEGVFNEEGDDDDNDNNNKLSRDSVTSVGSVTVTNPYRRKNQEKKKKHDQWCIAHRDDEDPLLSMVEAIFGYPKGSEITTKNGINEFLSAVVAVRQLEHHLNSEQLSQIVCCIEATIPFNNSDKEHPDNTAHMERLYKNTVETKQHCKLKLTDEECVKAVQLAATLANEDIGNFGTSDRYWFLDNTWSLLPETNTSLRQQFLYTIMEYQKAVFNMNGFFNFLDPNVIFSAFRGVPEPKVVADWTDQARRNLELGRKYVGAKLLSASVLAAFAQLTGGDAPMCLLMGDLPSRHHNSQKLEDSLPIQNAENVQELGHCDMDVYNILSGGRRSESSFDTKQSPLAAYLYAKLGDVKLTKLLKNNTMHPMDDDDNARNLLISLPRESTEFLARIMATIAVSRAGAIHRLLEDLAKSDSDEKENGGNNKNGQ
ncbi:expressed unknown protein [Seminavis robusta]|uniref:Uncharacterized protein n=1 Tax=Seminavis robusta TaxID=568900 RepID=A0A9N8ENZ9_9STRA|nr:expressed unknown protein [Seminavis robusta]|eukprot:Sro1313_g261960.1 n/a (567) ;mRNA; f:23618-25318